MPLSLTDINENKLAEFGNHILAIFLSDKTTKRNIIWATKDYEALGEEYHSKYPITMDLITGRNAGVIQPRVLKGKENRISRTKGKAEVFTPAWICNQQNNLLDRAWFGKDSVFNVEGDKTWHTNEKIIVFPRKNGLGWRDYVDARRLEITCGEAPYLTSRYDMATGESIPIYNRIGLLDRKLRVVNENTSSIDEWVKWAMRALESVYGFEFQGDSLLIARENILYTFIENMQYKFHTEPDAVQLRRAANIIAWNVWQMDGLTYTVPFGAVEEQYEQMALENIKSPEKDLYCKALYCKIHDWRSKKTLLFKSLVEREKL